MSVSKKLAILLIGLYAGAAAVTARAQFIQPLGPIDYFHDMQLFAPVELDFGNEPTGRTDGYFFVYDKSYWATTGERAAVGDTNVRRQYQPVWFDNAPEQVNPLVQVLGNFAPGFNGTMIGGFPVYQGADIDLDGDGVIDIHRGAPLNPDTGNPIARPFYITGIQSSAPTAVFAWGDRYEMGFVQDGRGWLAGFIDGPEFQTGDYFGINGGSDTTINAPFLDQDGNPIVIGQIGQEDHAVPGLKSPFGDVYVAFNYEPGLMHGFVDLVVGVIGTGRVLPNDVDGDGILDGDGIADDLDEDGQYGPDGFDAQAPVYIPETGFFVNDIPDYDDLAELPTSFRSLSVRNATETNGVELMRMHELSNRHLMRKHQNNRFEFYYGARFFQFDDEFFVQGEGGVLGRSNWDTEIENNLIGPQVMLRWYNRHGRWETSAQGRFTLGYNVTNWRQTGAIGEDLVPGRYNHPLYLTPKSFQYGRRDNDLAPLAEIRLESTYHVSKSVALRLGYTAMFIDGIRRASTHIDYTLPNMGFVDGGSDSVFINGLTGGFELNY